MSTERSFVYSCVIRSFVNSLSSSSRGVRLRGGGERLGISLARFRLPPPLFVLRDRRLRLLFRVYHLVLLAVLLALVPLRLFARRRERLLKDVARDIQSLSQCRRRRRRHAPPPAALLADAADVVRLEGVHLSREPGREQELLAAQAVRDRGGYGFVGAPNLAILGVVRTRQRVRDDRVERRDAPLLRGRRVSMRVANRARDVQQLLPRVSRRGGRSLRSFGRGGEGVDRARKRNMTTPHGEGTFRPSPSARLSGTIARLDDGTGTTRTAGAGGAGLEAASAAAADARSNRFAAASAAPARAATAAASASAAL
eukprot:29892-Pelagococcus_subviridis.AAC.4